MINRDLQFDDSWESPVRSNRPGMRKSLLESFMKDRGKRNNIKVGTGMAIQPGQDQRF